MNIEIIPRSIFSLLTLFLITKLIGKKQVSELSLFDYVIGISIGNFTAEMTMNLDGEYINGVIAILVFGISSYIVSYITMKSIILRRLIIGVPTILIQEGKIMEKSLKYVKIDVNDLLEQCRINGYFDLNEIKYAVMEANGKISIMPYSKYNPITAKDMNIKVQDKGLCSNIIIDGKIMKNNIYNTGKTMRWIEKELKIRGYKKYNNILLATLDMNDKLTIYEKNKNVKVYNVLE